ncbi:Pentatricopeptide repeat-containing protein [Cynara cardunculus var. scolymus]|uniref:Pentatricopeptide repeat-containing protein n=1 Tax=Cynara cardunculus var. scolymus TaxID=59895 RepID=A0A103XIH2_CYNCS|nr:Pentatricopeptide repeat-containing protein [Cynara cardunculus var. scolymus]
MYAKITKLDDAFQLFDEMTQRKPLPSVIKFNQLLQVVAKLKHYSSLIDLFKKMVSIGVLVDVYTTNTVIMCCCQMYRTSEGFAIVAYGLKRGVVPNVFTFNTILNGLILEDRILEAKRLFKKVIKEQLCDLDVVTYNTMIKGLCKFGNNDTAISLLRMMNERGYKPIVSHMTPSLIVFARTK